MAKFGLSAALDPSATQRLYKNGRATSFPFTAAPAPADTTGPSYTAQHSPEHIQVNSRELAAVMDVVCTLATTQASLDHRMA